MLLLQEFQSEKFKKEKADQVRIEQTERKVISIKKEEVSKKEEVEKIIAKADKLSGPSVLGKIDLTPKPKLPTKNEEPKVEIKKAEEKAEEKVPKVEQEPSSKKSEEKVSEPKDEVDTIKAEAKKLSGPKYWARLIYQQLNQKVL